MKKVKITTLESLEQAGHRPPGYAADCLSRAMHVTGDMVYFEDEAYAELRKKYHEHRTSTSLLEAARKIRWAALSVAKTSLGIDRLPTEQVKARLDVCRRCPGKHARWKGDDVHTCGEMLKSLTRKGTGPCGCLLHKKACDAKEDCPFGYWPR